MFNISSRHTDVGGNSGGAFSGDAVGGSGFDHGPGGNAYTGSSGDTRGGNVINNGGGIDNEVDMICKDNSQTIVLHMS